MSRAGAAAARASEGEAVPDLSALRVLITPLATLPGALLPVLHAVQDHLGYVPDSALPLIAEVLNLSVAEVHGVVTFYHWFRRTPRGQKIVRVCRAEACQAMGANALVELAEAKLGVPLHETRADGAVTLDPIYCLGNCGCAPAVMVDDRVYGRVTPARLEELLRTEGLT